MTNIERANTFLTEANKEMERMKTYATVRAAVYTAMSFVCVMVDVKGALSQIATQHKNIADEMDRANRNRR